ncbi:MAG: phosphatidate cytidylyltransferase [Lentisphaerae bacterium]|nr:phosphatidate cytidylyltransferase [Lentisphaerota bacterium]
MLKLNKLTRRFISGSLISIVLVVASFHLPSIFGWLLIMLISSFAQLEFYSMMRAADIRVHGLVGVVCGAGLIAATFATAGPDLASTAAAFQWEQLVLLVSLVAVFVCQFPVEDERPLSTIACTLLGIWYVPFLFNFLTHLAFAWERGGVLDRISETGRMLVLYLVVVVKSADIGAYFIGRFLGRHKLFPRISPAKTWEGLIGGLITSLAASVLFCAACGGQLGTISLQLRDVLILGVLLGAAGSAGDMFESLVKRAAGIKDSGSLMPGMGGMLDVIDSLLFGAPVLYVYCRQVLT